MNDPKRLFIGGTGRSGTSVLYKLLGQNRDIHSFPWEMRFIIDPDGILDMVNNLGENFTSVGAREALFRFERMMKVYLAEPRRPPYENFAFRRYFGMSFYDDCVAAFIDSLTLCSYTGSDYHVEPDIWDTGKLVRCGIALQACWRVVQGKPSQVGPLWLERPQLRVGRYFQDSADLNRVCAGFIDDLFMHVANKSGKCTWVEKTPSNLLSMSGLRRLFPDHLFIHVKRDPRGVVHSFTQQYWAPSRIQDTVELLRQYYLRWADLRASLDFGEEFMEFKLEDLAENQESFLREIARRSNIGNEYVGQVKIEPEKVNYWRNEMSSDTRGYVEKELAFAFDLMGYKI